MSSRRVDIRVEKRFRSRVQPEELRHAAEVTLQLEDIDEPCELAVAVTGDETLRQLNRRHRGIDAPTDVLAFPQRAQDPAPNDFVNPPGMPRYLGDVIISFPRAEAQAAGADDALSAELQLLVIHGVLHLLGYDHEAEGEQARMWQSQQDTLDEIGIEVHLED